MTPVARPDCDALVVGAGMAGLACATRLSELGWAVTVCEARRTLGGRASSWLDPLVGAEVDNGQHLLAGAYREVAALLARVGATDRVRFAPRLRVPLVDAASGRRTCLEWASAPGSLGLALGFLRLSVLSLGERLRLAAVPLAARDDDLRADLPLGAWLASLRQPPAARRWLWDPLARAVFNEEPERVSARMFAAVLRKFLLAGPRAAALGHARQGLADVYARPAAAYLETRGSAVLGASEVRAVRAAAGRFEAELAEGAPLRARGVCLAVPPARAVSVLGADLARHIPLLEPAAALPHAPSVCVNLWLEGEAPLGAEPFVGYVDSEFAWRFDRGALAPAPAPGRHVVLVAPGARSLMALRAAALVRRAHHVLREHEPATRARALVAARAIKEPHAALSLTPEAAATRPAQDTSIPGLALAGDWTDTGLPATLESAAAAGHAAARVLHRFLSAAGGDSAGGSGRAAAPRRFPPRAGAC